MNNRLMRVSENNRRGRPRPAVVTNACNTICDWLPEQLRCFGNVGGLRAAQGLARGLAP